MDLSCKELQEMIVTVSWDNTTKIWDVSTGQLLHNLTSHTDSVRSANFSPDGLKVVTASRNNTTKIWKTLY